MALEYLIFCDESVKRGEHFSNFYGGAIVSSQDHENVRSELAARKAALNFNSEVKWQKITENYRDKYIDLMDAFFDLISEGKVRVRIMFTQNMFAAVGLSAEQRDNEYFLLYYQFIKNAFGFMHRPEQSATRLRLYLDQLPDSREKIERFKGYLLGLNSNSQFSRAGFSIAPEDIADVDSKHHDILQCLDVVLGAMQFRLNDKHLEKLPGKRLRGKRTKAKEVVYKHILKRVRLLYPNFNIGISTGSADGLSVRWSHPYRHWLMVARNHRIEGASKRKK